jgi:hypothetical protein
LKNHEKELESKDLMIEKLSKANEYFKGRLQDQCRKDSITPKKSENLRVKAQSIFMITSKLREIISLTKSELHDEITFFKAKVMKNLEIGKAKVDNEVQKRKIIEQTCERLKKDISLFQSSFPTQDFNSNQFCANISFRGTEKDSVSKRFGLSQADDYLGSSQKKNSSLVLKQPLEVFSPEAQTPARPPLAATHINRTQATVNSEVKTISKGSAKKDHSKKDADKEDLDLKSIELESLEISKRIERLKNLRGTGSASSTLNTSFH